MISISSPNSHDPALAELVQYSSQALLHKETEQEPERLANDSVGFHASPTYHSPQSTSVASKSFQSAMTVMQTYHSYAAPLSPLRDRDLKALADLFGQTAIDEIEADILANLLSRFPEPCWEDHVFDFLKDYL
jgi:hypothetical protein